jgi:hypothetical protein
MTDEERKGLCENLREPWRLCDDVDADLAALMTSAANEIERLVAENAELKNTQLKFRAAKRQSFTIRAGGW